jgi:hypothetical protein
LERIKLAPILLFLFLSIIFFTAELGLIYYKFIPGLVDGFRGELSDVSLVYLQVGLDKIVLALCLSIFFFILVSALLIYLCLNMKVVLQLVNKSSYSSDGDGDKNGDVL